jgi:hypothetical protein
LLVLQQHALRGPRQFPSCISAPIVWSRRSVAAACPPTLGSFGGAARFPVDHSQIFGLLEDQTFFAIDQHLGTRSFAEQRVIADFDIERTSRPFSSRTTGLTASTSPSIVSPLPCRE